jgi:hypothetical protein
MRPPGLVGWAIRLFCRADCERGGVVLLCASVVLFPGGRFMGSYQLFEGVRTAVCSAELVL